MLVSNQPRVLPTANRPIAAPAKATAMSPGTAKAVSTGEHVAGAAVGAAAGGVGVLLESIMFFENPGRAIVLGAGALGAAVFGTLGWFAADKKKATTGSGVAGAAAGGAVGAVPLVGGLVKAFSATGSDSAPMLWGGIMIAAIGAVTTWLGITGGKKLGDQLGGK